jgi:hypothetical protein
MQRIRRIAPARERSSRNNKKHVLGVVEEGSLRIERSGPFR